MTNKPEPNAAAARFLRALEAPNPLSCEEACEQLPAFVEAEAAGQDVDADPAFAALLQHLDHCADCITLYEELAANFEAALNPAETLPALSPAPTFFLPARQSQNVILTVLGALHEAFQLQLNVRLPATGALSGAASANLFTDTLAEVAGTPLLIVSLVPGAAGQPPDLLVAVQNTTSRWQVTLATPGSNRDASTDAQGIARFAGVAIANGEQLELRAHPLPT